MTPARFSYLGSIDAEHRSNTHFSATIWAFRQWVMRIITVALLEAPIRSIFNYAPSAGWQSGAHNGLPIFLRWDSQWYLHIATNGYLHSTQTAFFPLYPLLTRVLKIVTFGYVDTPICALIVSNGSLVIFLAVAKKLDLVLNRQTYSRVGLLLLWSPTSIFLMSAYPESTFLLLQAMLLIGQFRSSRLNCPLVAGLLAVASPGGLALTIGWVLMQFFGKKGSRTAREALANLLLTVFPFVCWLLYQFIRFGQPFAFLRAQGSWSRGLPSPLGLLKGSVSSLSAGPLDAYRFILNCGAYLLLLVLVGIVVRSIVRRRVSSDDFLLLASLAPIIGSVQYGAAGAFPEAAARHTFGNMLIMARIRQLSSSRVHRFVLALIFVITALTTDIVVGLGYGFT